MLLYVWYLLCVTCVMTAWIIYMLMTYSKYNLLLYIVSLYISYACVVASVLVSGVGSVGSLFLSMACQINHGKSESS